MLPLIVYRHVVYTVRTRCCKALFYAHFYDFHLWGIIHDFFLCFHFESIFKIIIIRRIGYKRKCEPVILILKDRPSTALRIDKKNSSHLWPYMLEYIYTTPKENVFTYSNSQMKCRSSSFME